jgi:hypothetical protein
MFFLVELLLAINQPSGAQPLNKMSLNVIWFNELHAFNATIQSTAFYLQFTLLLGSIVMYTEALSKHKHNLSQSSWVSLLDLRFLCDISLIQGSKKAPKLVLKLSFQQLKLCSFELLLTL